MSTYKEKAEEIRARFNTGAKSILEDERLSSEAKRADLDTLYGKVADDMTDLREEHRKERAVRVSELQKRLTAPSFPPELNDGINKGVERSVWRAAVRDAYDRAEALEDPQRAVEVYERAVITGDQDLVRALAGTAIARGWTPVLERHFADHESEKETLSELRSLSQTSPKERIGEEMTFALPTLPDVRLDPRDMQPAGGPYGT